MAVQDAFGHAGGAGRIEPEGDLVRAGAGGIEGVGGGRGKVVIGGVIAGVAAGHHDPAQELEIPENGLERGQQRMGDEQHLGAAVVEDVLVLRRGQEGVEGDGHDTGLDRAPEDRRIVDRVEHDQRDAVLAVELDALQRVGGPVHADREVAIGVAAGIVDDRKLVATPLLNVAIDHVDRGIVDAIIAGHVHLPGQTGFHGAERNGPVPDHYC